MRRQEVAKLLSIIEKLTDSLPEEQETICGKYYVKTLTEEEANLIEPIWISFVDITITTGKISFHTNMRVSGPILRIGDDEAVRMCFYSIEDFISFRILMKVYCSHLAFCYKKIKYADLLDNAWEPCKEATS